MIGVPSGRRTDRPRIDRPADQPRRTDRTRDDRTRDDRTRDDRTRDDRAGDADQMSWQAPEAPVAVARRRRSPVASPTSACLRVWSPRSLPAGITSPFPIQSATIPDALAGRDVLGRGRTGSGKTLGFGLPMITTLAGSVAPSGCARAPRPGADP